jgi:hypothetical protein
MLSKICVRESQEIRHTKKNRCANRITAVADMQGIAISFDVTQGRLNSRETPAWLANGIQLRFSSLGDQNDTSAMADVSAHARTYLR